MIAAFRSPLVLARQAAALDRLSEGRLILGLGVGWMAEEFRAAGVPMKERGRRTNELIELLRQLWDNSNPDFRGWFTEFPEIQFEPKPVQKRVPIWIGGMSDAAIRRVAKYGDGWTPMSLEPKQLRESIEFIRQELHRHQRQLQDIAIFYSGSFEGKTDVLRMRHDLETYQKLGITHFSPIFRYNKVGEMIDQMKIFANEVIVPYHSE